MTGPTKEDLEEVCKMAHEHNSIKERAKKLALQGRLRYRLYARNAEQLQPTCEAVNTADTFFTHFVMDEAQGFAFGSVVALFTNVADALVFYLEANKQNMRVHGVLRGKRGFDEFLKRLQEHAKDYLSVSE